MTAIPKALAMANPKHVAACVASAACVISSKFAIDAVGIELDDTDMEDERIKRLTDNQTDEEIDRVIGETDTWDWKNDPRIKEKRDCLALFSVC